MLPYTSQRSRTDHPILWIDRATMLQDPREILQIEDEEARRLEGRGGPSQSQPPLVWRQKVREDAVHGDDHVVGVVYRQGLEPPRANLEVRMPGGDGLGVGEIVRVWLDAVDGPPKGAERQQ
jgi:hypothetical protein